MGPRSVCWVLSSQEGRQDPPALGSDFSPQFSCPLLTTPGRCKISASPTPCPVAAGCYGEGLYPRCGGLSILGWGRRKSPEMAAGEKLGNFTAPSPLCQQNYPYRRAVIFQQCKYFLNELEGGGLTNVVLLENVTELGREMAEEQGGQLGGPLPELAACRSILPFCIKPKHLSHLLSILLFVHLAGFIIQRRLSSLCPVCQRLTRC